MSELAKFIQELEVETKVTEVFSKKLDILDFVRNNLTAQEYQQCLASIAGTLESIIKQKDEETKAKIYKNLKNPINYTSKEEIYNITIHTEYYDQIIEKTLKEYPNIDQMMKVIDEFNTENKKSEYYQDFIIPYESENIKEILILGSFRYTYPTDVMTKDITKIVIDIDYLDKYLNLLYIGYKYLTADNSTFLDYYKVGDSTFLAFDMCIKKSKLFELAGAVDLEDKLAEKPYDGPAKIIKASSKADLKKLCLDGAGIFKLFYEQAKEPITLSLGFEWDDPLKYFRYNGKLYSLQVTSLVKRLFIENK